MEHTYCMNQNPGGTKIVNLGEYRRRVEMSRPTSLAPKLYQEEEPLCLHLVEPEEISRSAEEERREERSERKNRRAWALDILASLSVIAMTAAFTLTVVLG